MSQNRDKYAAEIGSAVRAEASRRGEPIAALEPVLGMSRTSLYSHVRGETCFDYAELVLIAKHLGMTVSDLIASAEMGRAA